MWKSGNLFVFVLKDAQGHIHGICDDWKAVQAQKADLKNWGFDEPEVDAYKVRTSY